jgi:hypothetical protein
LKRWSDILSLLNHERHDFEPEHACCSLSFTHFKHGLGIADVEHDGQPVQPRNNLTRDFQSLAGEFVRLDR